MDTLASGLSFHNTLKNTFIQEAIRKYLQICRNLYKIINFIALSSIKSHIL